MAKAREWTSRNGGTVTVEHCTIYGTKREAVGTVREVLDDSQSQTDKMLAWLDGELQEGTCPEFLAAIRKVREKFIEITAAE